jgi:hypothetical protein
VKFANVVWCHRINLRSRYSSNMPKYQGFGKEVVTKSGDLTLLNAHNTYKVIVDDEIWRAADADYDIVAH